MSDAKIPPSDTPENARTRSWVVLSFWSVVLLLGVPLWWCTTSIYRAPLPLNEMQSWANGRACRAEFPLLVDVEAPLLPDPEHLLKTVQHALDDANDFSAHHLRLRLSRSQSETSGKDGRSVLHSTQLTSPSDGHSDEDESVAAILRLTPGESGSTHSYQLNNSSRVIDLYYSPSYNPSSTASSTSLSIFISNTLQEIFAEEQQMISHLLSSATSAPSPSPSAPGTTNSSNGSNKVNVAEVQRKMSRIMRYSPTYHLTFSLFTASGTPTSWEIERSIDDYLQPLLDALSGISNFTVDSQVQFYASMSPNVVPSWVPDNLEQSENLQQNGQPGKWVLKRDDLSSFINSAEWPLASITSYPTINFIVYVPLEEQTPLYISESATNAFLLPQWGGVMVLNPSKPTTHLSKDDLKPALDIFAAQLMSLLGAPSHPPSLPIRLDSLTRQRSAELLTSASSTLGSLYRLTKALPSISIPTSVSTSVGSTLSSLNNACRELKRGRFSGPGGALEEGRNAASQAEKAFFEKSMVGQVYFPEEHKVAVYLPLMGPVGVPLLMSAVKEIMKLIKDWKIRRAGAVAA
ncbi:phosphatidylinositol-glycan biosynthesis class S protein [Pyronema domesticum]|uniref:Similar to GPI transamidase component PIG-S acc. no. Q5XI31 n=1 Tax=Pyronema omphalodes (strain CBS 100304) TaxID=1076935 RepID=U4LL23_PYROM|nr:phosphatidylinositol-glycan biosynthesis class S protein [Pyronema domesticum]CCX13587.1 Similar to GPI transamidase component PIG-S; acc. no. Q5XI31 [Pyronema omphalodes CBS 100304]